MTDDHFSSANPPPLLQGDLDAERRAALFADLASCAEILHVRIRTHTPPADRESTLDEARELLEAGRAATIQIRYRHDGRSWCDTLLVQPAGVRLVRMEQGV